MGTKRKADNGRKIAKEGKTSGAFSETTNAKEKNHSHTDKSTVMEAKNVENKVLSHSNGLSLKNKDSKVTNIVVRRSVRLKSSLIPSRRQEVEPVVEHVNLVEDEKDKPPHLLQNMEEKADNPVRAVDGFKSEVITRRQDVVSSAEFSYKSLYISSQKKNEDLMEENCHLAMKLEFALGKIEAYEKMKDVMGALKDMICVPSLAKPTEATVSLSPQTTIGNCTSPAPAPAPDASDADEQKTSPKQKKKNYKNASTAANGQKTLSKQKKKNY